MTDRILEESATARGALLAPLGLGAKSLYDDLYSYGGFDFQDQPYVPDVTPDIPQTLYTQTPDDSSFLSEFFTDAGEMIETVGDTLLPIVEDAAPLLLL